MRALKKGTTRSLGRAERHDVKLLGPPLDRIVVKRPHAWMPRFRQLQVRFQKWAMSHEALLGWHAHR